MGKVTVNFIDDKVSEHFRMDEAICHSDGNKMLLTPDVFEFWDMLEEFRVWYNRAMNPNSWYRTNWFNSTLPDASPTSRHLRATAVDESFPSVDHNGLPLDQWSPSRKNQFLENVMWKWYDICDKRGRYGGVGFYDWGFHIDLDVGGTTFRHWDYRGKAHQHRTMTRNAVKFRTKVLRKVASTPWQMH